MDMQAFNETLNRLKEIVGPHGSFVFFSTSLNPDGTESLQLRTFGPRTHVEGLFNIGSRWMQRTALGFDGTLQKAYDPD